MTATTAVNTAKASNNNNTVATDNKAVKVNRKKRGGTIQLGNKGIAQHFSTVTVATIKWPLHVVSGSLAAKRVDSIGHAVDSFIVSAVNGLPDTAELVRQLQALSDKYQRHNEVCKYAAAAHTYKHAGQCFLAYRPESNRQVKALVKTGFTVDNALATLGDLQAPAQQMVLACRQAAKAAKQAGIKAAKAAKAEKAK